VGSADVEFVLRLLLATGCGLLIGLERQYRSRTAGLRTNALVAAGAAVFVQFGEQSAMAAAPLQIAAYVVSGVGFLGGGVILRQGFNVQGLNTAATLWCSAAVGCQAAGGHLIPALATTAVVLGVHVLLRPVGRLVDRAPAAKDEALGAYTITVLTRRKHEIQVRAQLLQALTAQAVTLQGLSNRTGDASSSEPDTPTNEVPARSGNSTPATVELRAEVLIEGNPATVLDPLITRLSLEPGVGSASWRSEDPDPRGEDDRDEQNTEGPGRRPRWLPRPARNTSTNPQT
jgi:putative Mg2+ transporter-C (MgtC) family protein